jgi:hypothetical protein
MRKRFIIKVDLIYTGVKPGKSGYRENDILIISFYRRKSDEYLLELITYKQTGLIRQKEHKIYN